MRRKFYELADSSPVATEVLRRIAMLYAIEDQVRGTSAEQRRAERVEQASGIVDELRIYLKARLCQVSAKSKLADAICYALVRWPGLSLFLDDGRWIPIPSSGRSGRSPLIARTRSSQAPTRAVTTGGHRYAH